MSRVPDDITIERRGRKGRKERSYFSAAFAAFAFQIGSTFLWPGFSYNRRPLNLFHG